MAKGTNDLEKRTYNAEEALNLIISEDYSFGTSSSEDSSQSSSSYDSINGNSLSPSPILKKAKKMTGVTEERSEEDMLFRHGDTSTLGVLETHVQPTFNTPISPEAVQESYTPQTPQHDHDNCQNGNLPDTVPNSTTTQELVVSIPIDFEVQNEYNEDMANVSTFLEDGTLNNPPDEIEFPPEYFTNAENDPTSSDHKPDQYDYIIETETDVNEIPPPLQYPIVNCEQDIELQEDIDNGWLKVENDQVADHCHFIGNEGLNMNTTS